MGNSRADKSLDGLGNAETDWDCEDVVTTEEVSTYCVRAKLQEAQRVWEESDKAVSTSVVGVIKLACYGIVANCKNAKLPECSTSMQKESDGACAECSMACKMLDDAERKVMNLKVQLAAAELALEKRASKTAQTETVLCTWMVLAQKLLSAKTGCANRLE